MLDHVFLDAIGALRDTFESALLERQASEERFHADVLLGDLTWETSYSLPGEGLPPRVIAEITLEWPTWSQTAWRSWSIGENVDERPEINIEIVLRVQRLTKAPDPSVLLAVLPTTTPVLGERPLERSSPLVEQVYDDDVQPHEAAIEVSYEGVYRLDDEALADGSTIDGHFAAMGGWIASTLVRLGDLRLEFLPAEEDT
jgi:hypothetical protein